MLFDRNFETCIDFLTRTIRIHTPVKQTNNTITTTKESMSFYKTQIISLITVTVTLLISPTLAMHDKNGNIALHLAARRKDLQQAQRDLAHKPTDIHATNNNGDTPLHLACGLAVENVQLVQLLLTHKAPIDARNKKQCTPLHAAAASGHTTTTILLINNKADVNAMDDEEHSPLYYAIVCKEVPLIRALIQAGAQIPDLPGIQSQKVLDALAEAPKN